ncbi:MAG: flavodoxin family protein [Dehalococcoidales bacterium]|nr:flavodoxin family protein [Dehalococcoidales bacterium]
MKILLLSGSKNREGRTVGCLKAIADGAEKAGAETETVVLTELKLSHCRQCEADGWGACRREGYCVVDDDFQEIVDKITESDVVVFATPVYFRDLSESMKSLLDRLRRTTAFREGASTQGKIAVGVCLAGGGGGGSVQASMNLESTLQMCRFDVVDMIPVRRQNYEYKLPVLRLTGEWLATKPASDQVPR